MKNHIGILFFVLFTFLANGQNVPKFALVEHFTNTWCPICASRNPNLNTLLLKYPKDVHHISFHPPYPYSGCPLYQYNKTENQDRANFYRINGSPSVVMNGGAVLGGSPLLTEASLKTEIAKTSPVSVVVTETKNGNARTASINIKSNSAVSGSLKLFAMIVEKNLRFTASNGELDHYNVFRKFITPSSGQTITIAAGSNQKFDFGYQDDADWKSDEIYVLAFVQNITNNEILNSGTKFDATITSTNSINIQSLKVFPTIAKDQIFIELPNNGINKYSVFNVQGQSIENGNLTKGNQSTLGISHLSSGVYWLKINDGKNVYAAKFIKG